MKITATVSEATATKLGIKREPVEVEANIPETLADKVKLFGEDVVNGAAEDALVINVQALVRRMMVPKFDKAGKKTSDASSLDEIKKAVAAWKPDVRTVVRQTAFEKATSSLDKLTPDERKALLASLQKMQSAQAAPAQKAA